MEDPAWGKSSGRPVNKPAVLPSLPTAPSGLGTRGAATGSRDSVDGRPLGAELVVEEACLPE